MKKLSTVLVLLLAIAMVAAACGGNSSSKDSDWVDDVTILTGGEAGTYFPLGVAMGNIINSNVDGVSATGLVSGASVVNITETNEGQAEMGLVQNDIASYAAAGTHMFDKKHDQIRGIMTMYAEVIQIVTRADSGIVNVSDLVGKRVAVGDAGSGTDANANQILGIHGITYDDIKVEYMSFGDASTALQDGNIDAAFVTGGTPTAAIQQLGAATKIRIVNIEEDKISEIVNKYSHYTKYELSADTYGTAQGASTVTVQAMLIARADLPDDQVYEMTKAIFENLQILKDTHARGHDITIESALDGMSIPVHPGAQRFYDEQK